MSLKGIQRRIAGWLEGWWGEDRRQAENRALAEAGLDDVVEALESIEHPRLGSDARQRIWQAALARAETIPASSPAAERRRPAQARPTWQPRRAALRPAFIAVFLAIAMCFSSFGVTLAAQETYPNDTLYPVKRLSEDVVFSLASESARPKIALELLIRRAGEVEHLAQRQEPIPPNVLDQVDTHLRWIEQAERSSWEAGSVERLEYHIRILEELATQYPENAQLSLALSSCQRAYEDVSGQPYTPEGFNPDKESPTQGQVEPTVTPTPRPTRQYDPPQWDEDREDPLGGIEESSQSNPTPQPEDEGDNTGDEDEGDTGGGDEGGGTDPPPVEVPANDDDHVPPGQELTPPGQELTPPGQEDKENTPPGQEHTPPGQERTPPGQDKK